MIAVRAAGMCCCTVVCTRKAPADAKSPVTSSATHTPDGGKEMGLVNGHTMRKSSAIARIWASVRAPAS
jgi:hypothetical protein